MTYKNTVGDWRRNSERGWQARLTLRFEAVAARTELTRREHVGPLLVQRPFYPEERPCHVYIIHPPGGVASGDQLVLDVAAGPGAHALLTTPAAGKFYRRGPAGCSRVRQSIAVDQGTLEWLPQENIFYPQAAADVATVVQLTGAARFIGWEIACLGLPASERGIEDGLLRLRFELWRERTPLLLERLNMTQESQRGRFGLQGHAAFGTALLFPAGAAELELARQCLPANCADLLLACTLVDGVLVCRGTGRRADRLKEAFVRWWQALRPAVLGREAVRPRIWST